MRDATIARVASEGPTRVERKTPPATVTRDDCADDGDANAFDAGWTEASRYALVSELARGGGGRIAIAIDRKLGRRVALKRALDRDGDDRLEREALVLARLEHPAIVPIHDAATISRRASTPRRPSRTGSCCYRR